MLMSFPCDPVILCCCGLPSLSIKVCVCVLLSCFASSTGNSKFPCLVLHFDSWPALTAAGHAKAKMLSNRVRWCPQQRGGIPLVDTCGLNSILFEHCDKHRRSPQNLSNLPDSPYLRNPPKLTRTELVRPPEKV